MRRSSMRHLLIVAALVSACAKHEPAPEFVLRVAALGPLEALTPDVHLSYTTLVKGLVFQQVLVPGPDGSWRSDVLEQWERLGTRRYRLRLKPDLRFSDGSTASPEDLAKSLRQFGFSAVETVKGVEAEALDPGTTTEALFLRAVLSRQLAGAALGTGPFSILRQDRDSLALRRIEPQPGKIHRVELRTFPSPREAFAAALKGSVNFIVMPDAGEMELLEGVPQLRLVHGTGLHALSAIFNSRSIPEADRRALAESIPSIEIARAFDSLCEPVSLGASKMALPSGRPLRLTFTNFVPGMRRAALALRRALGARGGELRELSLPDFSRAQAEDDFDLVLDMVQVSPPVALIGTWGTNSSANWSHYSNPAFDLAIKSGNLDEADRLLQRAPPALLICRIARYAAVDRRVTTGSLGPYDMLETLPNWEVSP